MFTETYFTSGIFEPETVDALQRIYDEIAQQPWFDNDRESRRAFASHIIDLYRNGLVDFERLKQISLLYASKHHSSGPRAGKKVATG